MPIKKHVVEVKEGNVIEIPKSICDALGIGSGCAVRVYSNNNGYSFCVETVPNYEVVKGIDYYKELYEQACAQNKGLAEKLRKYSEVNAEE